MIFLKKSYLNYFAEIIAHFRILLKLLEKIFSIPFTTKIQNIYSN